MAINIISQASKDVLNENGNIIDTATVIKVEFTATATKVGDVSTIREFEIPSSVDINTYLQEQHDNWVLKWS